MIELTSIVQSYKWYRHVHLLHCQSDIQLKWDFYFNNKYQYFGVKIKIFNIKIVVMKKTDINLVPISYRFPVEAMQNPAKAESLLSQSYLIFLADWSDDRYMQYNLPFSQWKSLNLDFSGPHKLIYFFVPICS